MEPAPIQILSRAAFDLMLLSTGRHWVASIREQEADPIPRPEFFGNRINLAFYDLTDGPNIATAAHVEKVYRFSQRWAKAAHSDPTTATLVVHCFAGISRSSAIAMIPLLLYYRSEKAAAKRLYEINRWAPREISPSREPLLRNQDCRARVPRRKVLRMTKPLCQFVERLWNRCSPTPRHHSAKLLG